jgi:hypothetical protein
VIKDACRAVDPRGGVDAAAQSFASCGVMMVESAALGS